VFARPTANSPRRTANHPACLEIPPSSTERRLPKHGGRTKVVGGFRVRRRRPGKRPVLLPSIQPSKRHSGGSQSMYLWERRLGAIIQLRGRILTLREKRWDNRVPRQARDERKNAALPQKGTAAPSKPPPPARGRDERSRRRMMFGGELSATHPSPTADRPSPHSDSPPNAGGGRWRGQCGRPDRELAPAPPLAPP